MGYRGPIPKPSAIARAEGNPGKRRLNDCEPQPRATTPRCPAHLDAEAKKEWKRLVPILRRMRVLTEADGMTLANLCQAWSTMVQAQKKLTEMGILYKSPSGYIQQSPLLSVVTHYMDIVTKLCREFGLTPAARSRMVAQIETEPEDDLWAILNAPRERVYPPQPDPKPQ
jgi:P27 family predicted phage terminase small subunit